MESLHSRPGSERNRLLVLKKSPSWCLRGRQQQGYKQTRVSDAAGNRHSRRLAAYDGATRPFGVSCSTTSASKIRFLKTTCYVSSTATSASILCVRSCVHPTAKRGDRRLIRQCCCGSCCWGMSTASPVSAVAGRTAHALGVALVHRVEVRVGDSASLDVREEPACPLSGVEPVSGVV